MPSPTQPNLPQPKETKQPMCRRRNLASEPACKRCKRAPFSELHVHGVGGSHSALGGIGNIICPQSRDNCSVRERVIFSLYIYMRVRQAGKHTALAFSTFRVGDRPRKQSVACCSFAQQVPSRASQNSQVKSCYARPPRDAATHTQSDRTQSNRIQPSQVKQGHAEPS